MKTAYSYVRWSSPEQGEGNSKRRQVELSERWAARNGYTLDTTLTLRDEGRSGFKGAHATGTGKLAVFLNMIRVGVIKPGSGLILESLDRLSRQNINDAMGIARQILEAGVDIVTILPEQVYTKHGLETDAMTWMQLVWHFNRAHEESRMKSERTKDNWSEKRKAVQERKVVTAVRPFWLDIIQDQKVVPVGRGKLDLEKPVTFAPNVRSEVVRLIFKMADEGNGAFKIQAVLFELGLNFRRAVVGLNSINRLLRNRAVLGEYQPRLARGKDGSRLAAGEAVAGYYPRVIDADLFSRVQDKLTGRKIRGKGRKPKGMPNLFSGLLFDARDGSPLHLRQMRGKRYLTSYWAMQRREGSVWIDLEYDVLEKTVLKACRELSPSFLTPESPALDEVTALEEELTSVRQKIVRATARLDVAEDQDAEEVLTGQLARLVKKRREAETALDKARGEMSQAPEDQMKSLQTMIDFLGQVKEEDKDRYRTLVSSLVQSLVTRVRVYIQKKGKKTRYEKRAFIWLDFQNGRRRKIFVQGDVVVTMEDEGDDELAVNENDGWI